jgi:hypothetical protein
MAGEDLCPQFFADQHVLDELLLLELQGESLNLAPAGEPARLEQQLRTELVQVADLPAVEQVAAAGESLLPFPCRPQEASSPERLEDAAAGAERYPRAARGSGCCSCSRRTSSDTGSSTS